jgi:5-formyltetrahydrofolate cyclo-ligase
MTDPKISATTSEAKYTLRSRLRRQRAAALATLLAQPGRSRLQRDQISAPARLADALLGLITAPEHPVAAFISSDQEPQTAEFRARCRAQATPVLLPILCPDQDLDWAWDTGQERPGPHPGLQEPTGGALGRSALTQARLIIVPALAVDHHGMRLGQGGGSYDRALRRAHPTAIIVALVHPQEILPVVPSARHDQAVHAVVTLDEVRWFNRPPTPNGPPV